MILAAVMGTGPKAFVDLAQQGQSLLPGTEATSRRRKIFRAQNVEESHVDK